MAFCSVFSFLMMAVVLTIRFHVIEGSDYNHLLPGNKLKNGEQLTEGNYNLIMQPNCNLALYQDNQQAAIWSSTTDNEGNGCEASLKTDGNFAINAGNGTLITQTKTNNSGSSYVFLLQRDRNIVLYSEAIWNAGTNIVDQSSNTSTNQAMNLGNRGGVNGLLLLGACIGALLF